MSRLSCIFIQPFVLLIRITFGAQRVTDASNFNVWTRKATSKDGLEDWLIAFNIAVDDEQKPVSQRATLALIFAAARPVPVAEALKTWWGEKVKYWKAAPDHEFPKFKPMAAAGIRVFDKWEFSADGGRTWRSAKAHTWKLQFPDLKEHCGSAVYTVPVDWKGKAWGWAPEDDMNISDVTIGTVDLGG